MKTCIWKPINVSKWGVEHWETECSEEIIPEEAKQRICLIYCPICGGKIEFENEEDTRLWNN